MAWQFLLIHGRFLAIFSRWPGSFSGAAPKGVKWQLWPIFAITAGS
jgi:hypothetical protein